MVDNDYFNSPDDDFILKPGDNLTAPAPLVGLVNTFTLDVNVKSSGSANQAAGTSSAMTGVQVDIGRINPIPDDVPFEDGQNLQRKQSMALVPGSPLISTGKQEWTRKGQ